MVNNYPEYAAGVNFKKTDSNGVRHFYSAQVVADPSDETIESKLIKDGVVISEGGGGGSSDFSTAEVTIIVTGGAVATHFAYIDAEYEDIEILTPQLEIGEHSYTMPLYKNGQYIPIAVATGTIPTVTGNITYDEHGFAIKGDGTISVVGDIT